MEKAIIFAIICIFVILGIERVVEAVKMFLLTKTNQPVIMMIRPEKDNPDIEMILRSLAADSHIVKNNSNTYVYVADDLLDPKSYELCLRTAEQYDNVYVGSFSDAQKLL